MSNKQFNKRYSIEYLHPGNIGAAQTKKKSAIIPLIFFGALIATGIFLWKQGILDQFIQSKPEKSESEKVTIVDPSPPDKSVESKAPVTPNIEPIEISQKTSDLTSKPKVKNASLESPEEKEKAKNLENSNKLLISQLQKLTDQLSIEKKKNSMLSEQLKKNLEISKNISKLYTDVEKNAEKFVPQNNKSFLKIVEEEKKRINNSSDHLIKKEVSPTVPITQTAATSIVAVATSKEDKNSNTLEISTSSQMDKIVSAINNKTVSASRASADRGTTKRRIIVTTIESSVAQKTLGLQNKINQLVSETDVPKTKFTKALQKEKKRRRNSVRSVVVRKGDTLWRIAKRAYGTGFKYPKILKANPRLKRGRHLRLRVGQVLRVPK